MTRARCAAGSRARSARDGGAARDQADLRAGARERLERARGRAARAHHHDDAAARGDAEIGERGEQAGAVGVLGAHAGRARRAACSPRPTRAPRDRGASASARPPPCAGW